MSIPFGIDLGNYSSVLAVARNRGIDVVVNEVSNRATPSLVGFGPKSRYLGETAKSNETSNLKNTVGSLKRTLGRSHDDPALQEELPYLSSEMTAAGPNGNEAGVKVRFQGKERTFTSVQLAAMYLGKLRHTVQVDNKNATVSDVVLAVPVWYSEFQRRAAADAAIIAGLNPVRIVNDVTAAAVGYGAFRLDLPEDKPRHVAIVDVGHSSYTVLIGAFKKGELKVLGVATDRSFGGRVLDKAITEHFAEEFKDKYKIDINTHPKAYARVLAQSERLKKILSANSYAPFNVESVMNDIDVSSGLKRETLEEFIAPFVERMNGPVEAALAQAGVEAKDLDAVEVIGGTSRVPCIKDRLSALFGKNLSFTLNQDEAIALGSAFICAIHSPTVRVRPFKFEDINRFSVTYFWEPVEGEDLNELEVFPEGSPYPSTKVITLFRSEDFDLQARYTDPSKLDAGVDSWIGKWTIKGVRPSSTGEPVAVKCKLRMDPSGFYTVESAYTAEEVEVEEPVEEEGDKKEESDDKKEPATRKVKKWVKRDNLHIVHAHRGMDEKRREECVELEAQMVADDKLVADTEDRKNALEEYIYEVRGKIDEQWAEFANDDEKAKIRSLADAAEEWLYDDGDDATKAQYIAKYEEIAAVANIVRGRYQSKLEEERQAKLAAQEAERARQMAEKLAADKAAREAKEQEEKAKQEQQEQTEKKENGDVDMPDAPSA